MSLFDYEQTTQRLLSDTLQVEFNIFDLRDWINIARRQAATEGEAIRQVGTLVTVNGTATYPFSAIAVAGVGFDGVIAVRQIAAPGALVTPREWEWMFLYYLATPSSGAPKEWGQLGQGDAGSLYFGPTPNVVLTLSIDAVMLPAPLVSDSDVEVLPYPWTDAVPYFAAYMALLTKKMYGEADKMFMEYERFMMRARAQVTPTVLPGQYPGGKPARDSGTHAGIVGPSTPAMGGTAQQQGQR